MTSKIIAGASFAKTLIREREEIFVGNTSARRLCRQLSRAKFIPQAEPISYRPYTSIAKRCVQEQGLYGKFEKFLNCNHILGLVHVILPTAFKYDPNCYLLYLDGGAKSVGFGNGSITKISKCARVGDSFSNSVEAMYNGACYIASCHTLSTSKFINTYITTTGTNMATVQVLI